MIRNIFAILFILTGYATSVAAQVQYSIVYKDSLSSKLHISIRFTDKQKGSAVFIMPRSVPGAYSMIKYDDFVEGLTAITPGGEKLSMYKDEDEAPRWYCTDTAKAISQIVYEVDLRKMEGHLDLSDASIMRNGFAGLLNYSIFGWVDGTEEQPVQCSVHTFADWPIFTTNEPTAKMSKGTLSFATKNYYTLADGQLFIGPRFRVKEFKGLVPLFIVDYCQTADEYLDDYGRQGIMSLKILHDYFGELPFQHYSILLRKALPLEPGIVPPFGMEHLQSSTFFGDTSGFRYAAMRQAELVATIPTYLHHMGHSFIPLRCYGDGYRPFVQEIPPVIHTIWFNEGFMWFLPYDVLQSARWAKIFYANTYQADPQIKKMNLSELSAEASIMYSADFRLGKAVYARGASMAIEMDQYLKEQTGGKKSMKDVLRFLYNWSKENKRPFTLVEFPQLIHKACGVDLSNIFHKWELPIQ